MADSFTGSLTGGLIDPGSPNYGKLAGKNEKRRQQIIDLGMRQINSVFGGGVAPFYTAANTGTNKFDPHNTYYSLNAAHGFAPYWQPGGLMPSAVLHKNQIADLAAFGNTGGTSNFITMPTGFSFGTLFGNTES